MHELSITEHILNLVLKHAKENRAKKVVSVHLRIGEMTDLQDEWIQRYFDHLSKKTLAEGAVLKIERSPVVFGCKDCEKDFEVQKDDLREDISCPDCKGKNFIFVSGREFLVKSIEVM
jgi:hydrogenase nickel incorporation protein HypA/HybF